MLEAKKGTTSSIAFGSLSSPLLRCTKYPKSLPKIHVVCVGLSQAQTGIIQCSEKGQTMGIALFCTYPLCSSATKPVQLLQSHSSRWLSPSPSFPLSQARGCLALHTQERIPQHAGWVSLERNFTSHPFKGNFKAATIEQVAKTNSFS